MTFTPFLDNVPLKRDKDVVLPLTNSSYFKDLLESFSYGVVIFNAKEQAYAVNSMATRIFGRTAEECLGLGPEDLFADMEHFDAIQAMLHSCHQEGPTPNPVDTCIADVDVCRRHLSLAPSLLIENKKIFGILISMHDNTHIFQLHEREKRIIEQNNRLQRERAKSVLQLSRAMAHQIRNPVMTIGGFAKLMQRRVEKGSELEEFATAILDGSQRLEGMVKAFTHFTSISSGPAENVNLESLLDAALERGKNIALRNNTNVTLEKQSVSCMACVDPALTLQAMELFIQNSVEAGCRNVILRAHPCPQDDEDIDFLPKTRTEEAEQGQENLAEEENKLCCLEVEDDGSGISQENMPFIYDPFFSTKPESSGMGLCTARRIAHELGGALRIKNREQGGVLVQIRLPRAD